MCLRYFSNIILSVTSQHTVISVGIALSSPTQYFNAIIYAKNLQFINVEFDLREISLMSGLLCFYRILEPSKVIGF